MKRTYIQPETRAIQLQVRQMVATSIRINSTDEAVDAGDAAVRGSSWDIWDSNDDE